MLSSKHNKKRKGIKKLPNRDVAKRVKAYINVGRIKKKKQMIFK